MKTNLLITAAIALMCFNGNAQDYTRQYNKPVEIELHPHNFSSIWEAICCENTLTVTRCNYNFANDYCHLEMFDSISYTYDSWRYKENGRWIQGDGKAPLIVTVKGWSYKGNFTLEDQGGMGALNGYYNGVEFSTTNASNTTVEGLTLKMVRYEDAIQGHDAADGIDTYILTGDALCLPCAMKQDLRQLIGMRKEIRLDIRRMHHPDALPLFELVDFCSTTRRTIHIVGHNLYNRWIGSYATLIMEEDFEPAPKSIEMDLGQQENFAVSTPFHAEKITFTRELAVNADSTKNVNSMILPFEVTSDQLAEIDIIPYTVTAVTNTSTKTQKITGTIPANTPFIIKRTGNPKNTSFCLTVYDVDVPATPDNLQSGFLMGVYQFQTVPEGCKVLQGAAFHKVVGDQVTIAAFRAYVLTTDEAGQARTLSTSLFDLDFDEEEEAETYDLLGQRVSNTVRGQLYVRNGKKYIVR